MILLLLVSWTFAFQYLLCFVHACGKGQPTKYEEENLKDYNKDIDEFQN